MDLLLLNMHLKSIALELSFNLWAVILFPSMFGALPAILQTMFPVAHQGFAVAFLVQVIQVDQRLPERCDILQWRSFRPPRITSSLWQGEPHAVDHGAGMSSFSFCPAGVTEEADLQDQLIQRRIPFGVPCTYAGSCW